MSGERLVEICERLRQAAHSYSAADKMMADAKTARQTDRDDYPELGSTGYAWIKPEETDYWQAADLIEQLQARLAEAEGERDEQPAQEIGRLINRILELAPSAGVYVGIKVEPATKAIRP